MGKNFSNKYSQNLFFKKSSSKNSRSQWWFNKIADKIVSASKKPAKELPKEENIEVTNHKKRYISPEERQQIIDELRLVPKKDAYF